MDRAHRKRYMGVWRLRSLQMVAMMSRLPSSVKIHQQKQQEEHQLKAGEGGKANKDEFSHC
jgi:hypothetical protein